jgi:hypothetical protein
MHDIASFLVRNTDLKVVLIFVEAHSYLGFLLLVPCPGGSDCLPVELEERLRTSLEHDPEVKFFCKDMRRK